MSRLVLLLLLISLRGGAADAPPPGGSAALKREAKKLVEEARNPKAEEPAASARLRRTLEGLTAAHESGLLDDESQAWLMETDLLLDKPAAPADRARPLLDAAGSLSDKAASFDGVAFPAAAPVAGSEVRPTSFEATLLEAAAALLAKTGRATPARVRSLAERLSRHLSAHLRRAVMQSHRFFIGRDGHLRLAYRMPPRSVIIEDLGPFTAWSAEDAGAGKPASRRSAAKKTSPAAPAAPKGRGAARTGTRSGGAGARTASGGRTKAPAGPDSRSRAKVSSESRASKANQEVRAESTPRSHPAVRARAPRPGAFDEAPRRAGAPASPKKDAFKALGKKPGAVMAAPAALAPRNSAAAPSKAAPAGLRVAAPAKIVAAATASPPSAPSTANALDLGPAPALELRDALNGGASRNGLPHAPSRMLAAAPPPPAGSGKEDAPDDRGGQVLPFACAVLFAGAAAALLAALGQTGSGVLGPRNSARTKAS